MDKMNKARGLKATDEGIEKIKSKMATMPKPNNIDKIGWSQQDIADQSCVSVDTVKRFLKGTAIDRDSIIKIASSLGFEPTDLVNKQDWIPSAIDWQNICQKILDKKPLRRNITGNSIELNIFVKVGVNKLIQQQNSNTQEEYYSYDRFFSEVIENNDLRKLAIIGEPGSGKTTLLERIAKFANTKASIIWINLQRLKQKTIEEYLRQDWLKSILNLISQDLIDPTPELEKELVKLFNSGEVWLILDGVDEMAEKNAIDALDKISENITGWLAKAKIILSCRQNVWAENLNTIKDFQVYQTLNFSYGDLKEDTQDQVEDFIHKYFSQIEKFDLGLQLRQKLNETKYQRVKDLVRNPLRLSLLCQCWQLKQGELPQTKAEIYTLFVNSSYEWKAREHFISEEDQENLHQKLGELAKNGIDQDQPIFEFGKKYIVKLIGERFFKLAVDLHWLILIDINVNTNEKIYAFIHKTFQEYFASLVIDHWHFFLNHNNQNPNPFVKFNGQDCVYRVFESKWREVILLWFGNANNDQKKLNNQQNFLTALDGFNDSFDEYYFYSVQIWFLLAEVSTEVYDFDLDLKNALLEILILSAFQFDLQDNKLDLFCKLRYFRDQAKLYLKKFEHHQLICCLENILNSLDNKYPAEYLKNLNTLKLNLDVTLQNIYDESKLDNFNHIEEQQLLEIQLNIKDIRLQLQEIELKTLRANYVKYNVAEYLGELFHKHPIVIKVFKELFEFGKTNYRYLIIQSIGKLNLNDPIIINMLVNFIEERSQCKKSNKDNMLNDSLFLLSEIDKNNPILQKYSYKTPEILQVFKDSNDDFNNMNINIQELVDIDQLFYKNNQYWLSIILYKLYEIPIVSLNVINKQKLIKNLESLCDTETYINGIEYFKDDAIQQGYFIGNCTLVIANLMRIYNKNQTGIKFFQSILKKSSLHIKMIIFDEVFRFSHLRENFYQIAIHTLKQCIYSENCNANSKEYGNYISLIWSYAQTISYPQFYEAWHGDQSKIIDCASKNCGIGS